MLHFLSVAFLARRRAALLHRSCLLSFRPISLTAAAANTTPSSPTCASHACMPAHALLFVNHLQVDSSLSRLKILQERISNTEHLVNLDLDSKRNALVSSVGESVGVRASWENVASRGPTSTWTASATHWWVLPRGLRQLGAGGVGLCGCGHAVRHSPWRQQSAYRAHLPCPPPAAPCPSGAGGAGAGGGPATDDV